MDLDYNYKWDAHPSKNPMDGFSRFSSITLMSKTALINCFISYVLSNPRKIEEN